MLAGRRVVLGVTGGVAAYKAAYLARLLSQEEDEGFELWPVLTASAQRFIAPMTLSAICGRPFWFCWWRLVSFS